MDKAQKTKWEDIYGMWKREISKFPELSSLFHSLSIEFTKPRIGQSFYYNWVSKADEEKAVQTDLAALASGWPEVGGEWSKGTIKTAGLLILCETEEERAAVWLDAFARFLLRYSANGSVTTQNAWTIECEACSMIQNSFWHTSSREFFPEWYIPLTILREGNELSVQTLVKLAAVNAALVMGHYTPVQYKMAGV